MTSSILLGHNRLRLFVVEQEEQGTSRHQLLQVVVPRDERLRSVAGKDGVIAKIFTSADQRGNIDGQKSQSVGRSRSAEQANAIFRYGYQMLAATPYFQMKQSKSFSADSSRVRRSH